MRTASAPFIFLVISFISIFFVSVYCSSHDTQIQELKRKLGQQSVNPLDVQSIKDVMESSEKTLSVNSRLFLVKFISKHSEAINRVDVQMTRSAIHHKVALQQVLQAAEELNTIVENVGRNYAFHLKRAVDSLDTAEQELQKSEKYAEEASAIALKVQHDTSDKILTFATEALQRQKQYRWTRAFIDCFFDNGKGTILIHIMMLSPKL